MFQVFSQIDENEQRGRGGLQRVSRCGTAQHTVFPHARQLSQREARQPSMEQGVLRGVIVEEG